jgi:hypothetical protein
MSRPRTTQPPAFDGDDAYASLEAPDVLPVLSLVLFTVALGARPLVRMLPHALRPYPWGLVLPLLIGLVASTLGALLASWSLRGGRRRTLARTALAANLIVLVLNALAVAAMIWIYRR